MPKLNAGDSFILTREMNDAKIQCEFSCLDASQLIGSSILISEVEDDHYSTNTFNYPFEAIDPFLPNSSPKSSMSNLVDKFKQSLKQEPNRSFNKAGITDSQDRFTPEGQELFLAWLLEEYGKQFKTEVVDKLLKEEKK